MFNSWDTDAYMWRHQVNRRYHHGVLLLDRLNSIYRIKYFTTHFRRGYLYGYRPYTPFFERRFSWALIPFGVFLTVILSAMQVGTGLPDLGNNQAFLDASNGVVIFSMVCVLIVVSTVVTVQAVALVINTGAAFSNTMQQFRMNQSKRRAHENAR